MLVSGRVSKLMLILWIIFFVSGNFFSKPSASVFGLVGFIISWSSTTKGNPSKMTIQFALFDAFENGSHLMIPAPEEPASHSERRKKWWPWLLCWLLLRDRMLWQFFEPWSFNIQWFCPQGPWEDGPPNFPFHPNKERKSFINCWWNIRGIFQGYVGGILETWIYNSLKLTASSPLKDNGLGYAVLFWGPGIFLGAFAVSF